MVKESKDLKGEQSSLFNFPHSKIVYIVLAVVIVVGLAAAAIYRNQGDDTSNIAFRVGDAIVFESDYTDHIESSAELGIDEESARADLIEYYKNEQALKELDIPVSQPLVDAQWDLVLADISDDYLSSIDYQDKADTSAGQVLSFNKYVSVVRAIQSEGDIYVGALYHFPYEDISRESSRNLVETTHDALKGMEGDLTEDANYINSNLADIATLTPSYTGLYLINTDGDAVRMGGAFGSRTGLIPQEIIDSLDGSSLPYLSDIVDVELMAYYTVRAVDSFEVEGDLTQQLQNEKNKIRVVEYDR